MVSLQGNRTVTRTGFMLSEFMNQYTSRNLWNLANILQRLFWKLEVRKVLLNKREIPSNLACHSLKHARQGQSSSWSVEEFD